MHQFFDDSLPYRVVRIRPSALILKHYCTLLGALPPADPAAGRLRLTPKHYSPRAGRAFASPTARKPAAR